MSETGRSSVLSPLAQMKFIGGGFVLIIAGLRVAADIINTILLSYIITLLAAPIYRQFIRRRISPFITVAFVLLIFVIALVILGAFLAVSLSQIEAKLLQYEAGLQDKILNLVTWLAENGVVLVENIPTSGSFNYQAIISNVFGFVSNLLSGFARLFSNFSLVILIVFFALFEVSAMPDRLAKGLGAEHTLMQRFYRLNQSIRTYFGIKTLAGFITAVANTILLLVLGVEFAVLWGVLSFLTNYIPNIGFFLALIPAALVALLQFGLGKALIVIVGFWAINFLMDYIVSPRLMGRGMNLSPLIVFLALIFWTRVLGMMGAILSVSFMMIVKTLIETDEDIHWLSLMMSESAERS